MSYLDESLDISVINNNSSYSGIININKINLDVFNIPNTLLDTILLAEADSLENLLFTGNIQTKAINEDKESLLINSDINISFKELLISNMEYKKDNLKLLIDEIHYSIDKDYLSSSAYAETIIDNGIKKSKSYLDLLLDVKIKKSSNVFLSLYDTYTSLSTSFNSKLKINELNIDDKYIIQNKDLEVKLNNSIVNFTGDFLVGNYYLNNKNVDLKLNLEPIIITDINGRLNFNDLNVKFTNIDINASVYQPFNTTTTFIMRDNNHVNGEVLVRGKLSNLSFYGELSCENFEAETRYIPDDFIQIPDMKISLFDKTVITNPTPILMVNKNGERSNLLAIISQKLKITKDKFFDYFEIELELLKNNSPIFISPIISKNIGIEGKPYGKINILLINHETFVSGDLTLCDALLSYGLGPIPSWWPRNSKSKTRIDLSLTIGDNVQFILPYSSNPIITAYLKENTKISLKSSKYPSYFELNGDFEINAGEVFYFNKTFYIDNGRLSFSPLDNKPIINLKADIKDFDQDGNKFTISLLLQNTSLNNIDPKFVSTPSKNQDEIMYILGNSLMPADTTGEYSITSVASMLSSGFSAINSFNIDKGLSLTTLVQKNLNLDLFSIRTNLFENVIFENFSQINYNLTPLARYLNNTTMYLGNYISKDIFLQGMFKLVAQKDAFSLIDKDINIVTEITLDWDIPLADLSFFIKPTGTNTSRLFNTFGFSITKTLHF